MVGNTATNDTATDNDDLGLSGDFVAHFFLL
jgi:hypothetical protein